MLVDADPGGAMFPDLPRALMAPSLDFPIHPELRVRVGSGLSLRSIDQATEFARGMAKERNSGLWDSVLYRLEAARTEERARDAANALRALLEAEDLLVI
jgi:hypothetical protein